MARIIYNPTEEDRKHTPVFDPDKLPVCPNCGADMLRDKTTKDTVYLKCKGCKRRYRAERIVLVKKPIIKIWPSSLGDSDWLVDMMKPAITAIRQHLRDAIESDAVSKGALIANWIDADDETLADKLLHYDDTVHIGNQRANDDQEAIRGIIAGAIESTLDTRSIHKILRFAFYGATLHGNSHYNNVLQDWEKREDAVSMDLKPVVSISLKRKR